MDAPNIDDGKKPDTSRPYILDDLEEVQYDLDRATRTNRFLLAIIVTLVISSIMLSLKINSLENKIGFMETDYQILLQICNERE